MSRIVAFKHFRKDCRWRDTNFSIGPERCLAAEQRRMMAGREYREVWCVTRGDRCPIYRDFPKQESQDDAEQQPEESDDE